MSISDYNDGQMQNVPWKYRSRNLGTQREYHKTVPRSDRRKYRPYDREGDTRSDAMSISDYNDGQIQNIPGKC
jgi:hypothetical protein